MITRQPGPPREPPADSGEFLGTHWTISYEGADAMITIGDQRIHVQGDGHGGYTCHEIVGRWQHPGEIADALVRYHPDYSPLARRGGGVA
jgi:hypothetical protein